MSRARELLETVGCTDITVGRAPGRVNIIGEHTDYNGGLVLPMAIHLGVTTAVSRRTDDLLVIRSVQVPDDVVRIPLAELAPGACTGWAAYVAGAVWSYAQQQPLAHGLEIAIDGDVPLGAGLSSSAAVECSVIVTLAAGLGGEPEPSNERARAMARWAQRAENEFVGVPTGSMDQVASMLGREGQALFFDVRADRVESVPVDIESRGAEFIVVDTRASHALVDGGYADRRRTCEQAAQLLGIAQLRDVVDLDEAMSVLAGGPDGVRLMKRTRHVVTENQRVIDAVAALRQRDVVRLGELLCASHASLRDDYEVSCLELDLAVDASMAAGAHGARMMGGGFGGSAIVLAPTAARDEIAARVRADFERAGVRPAALIPVQAGPGAHACT